MKKHHKIFSSDEFLNSKNLFLSENKKKQIDKKLLLSPLNINQFENTNSYLTVTSNNKYLTVSNQKTAISSQNTCFSNNNRNTFIYICFFLNLQN